MSSGRLVSIIMVALWIALRPVMAELLGTSPTHPMTALDLSQTIYLEARRRVLVLAEQQRLQQARHLLVQVLRASPVVLTPPPARGIPAVSDRRHA